ncbi:MAG TPA: DHA2 family efflux MFS transporter permease subunit [Mycobacteriales bacterium]|nr:DHA2 family efflux MFS transporter permease subunit [Mycobacteriales bacterium]
MRSSAVAVDRRISPDVWPVAIVVILGMVMSALDTTIVNVALITLSRDLHTGLASVQWVVTAYLLALAVVVPVSGWAASKYGAKRVFIVSIGLFTVGSALCGLATSASMLIVFRILQGIGGGMSAPVGMMIVVKKSGPASLARVMSAIGIPIILAPIVAPTIGGLLLDHAGWRWIFYVNVPIGILTLIAATRLLPRDEPEAVGPLDVVGLVLAGVGLAAVTYGLAEAGTAGFGATKVWLSILLGVALVSGFVAHALRVEHPLLDMRLYASPAFSAASLTTFFLGAAMFGGMLLMPLYFQTVRGEDAVTTGMLLAPTGVGSALAVWVAGRSIDRIGAGVTALVGGLLGIVSTIPMLFIGAQTSYVLLGALLFFRGFATGLSSMPAMTAAYRVLRPDQVNDASPQLNVLQRVGGSLGTAILAVSLQNQLEHAPQTAAGAAAAFGTTFWWVLAIFAFATIPILVLMRIERQGFVAEGLDDLPAEAFAGAA